MADAKKGDAEESALLGKVKADVEKTGFPTEVLVTGKLQLAGWTTLDHMYYVDKDENKGREIDVMAIKPFTAKNESKSLTVNVALSVEVKKSESKPWVVMTSKKSGIENYHDLFETTLARMHHQEIWFHELYVDHPVTKFDRLGRAAFQAFGKHEAESDPSAQKSKGFGPQTFSSFVACFKACADIVVHQRNQHSQPLRDSDGKKTYMIGIAHGLVALNARLFEARTSNKGQVSVLKKSHIPYVFNYTSEKYPYKKLLIDIVTLDEFDAYLRRYDLWGNETAKKFLSEL